MASNSGDFDGAVASLLRAHSENTQLIAALQQENARLRQRVKDAEEAEANGGEKRPRYCSPIAPPPPQSTTATNPTSACSTLLQRLVSSHEQPPASPAAAAADPSAAAAVASLEGDTAVSSSSSKAAFRLIAHSGEDTEEICPASRDITLPVLVKSYVEFGWKTPPRCALVMLRPGDAQSLTALQRVAHFLFQRQVRVIVEPSVDLSSIQADLDDAGRIERVPHHELHQREIDFVVTLGGDGTFIHAADAFPRACPPILAFAFGSLGFLTPFPANNMLDSLRYVMEEEVGLRLRARLEVEVTRQDIGAPQVFQVLNECVIDRGTSSSLVRLMLYSNRDGRQPVTIVQGDGLILASPTGSTAYSLSAGGSMVHPSVPAILVTPICPHSLSFRPILVPDSATLRVQVALDARNSAYLSLDGKPGFEMKRGDEFTIRFSSYPVPAIMSRRTSQGDSDGWLSSLRTALNWNAQQAPPKPL